jgi:hypothetical protein
MRADRVRIVLDPKGSEHDLDPLIVKYRFWDRRRIGRNGDQPREYIFGTEYEDTNIHYIFDHKLGVNYLLVKGPEAAQIAQLLREDLFQESPPSIMRRAREANLPPAERRRALYNLALDKMEHGFDQETFDIYTKALKDPDPFVRASAVLGSAYLAWPELAEPLRPLSTDAEPDETIRKDAALLVGRLDALASPEN